MDGYKSLTLCIENLCRLSRIPTASSQARYFNMEGLESFFCYRGFSVFSVCVSASCDMHVILKVEREGNIWCKTDSHQVAFWLFPIQEVACFHEYSPCFIYQNINIMTCISRHLLFWLIFQLFFFFFFGNSIVVTRSETARYKALMG